MFENRVLRRISGAKGDKGTTEEWRKLRNEDLNDLYSTPIIVRVIISRGMRLVGHVSRTRERRGVYRVWWGNMKERNHL